MFRFFVLLGAVAALSLASAPSAARADFSACEGAYQAKDPHQQIDLYTTCLKHGGLMSTDVAGAFNNRGIAHERLGETELALQDFVSATQYDPSWPQFRINRASVEARLGQCAAALADMDAVLKMAPRNKAYAEERAQIEMSCPTQSRPAG